MERRDVLASPLGSLALHHLAKARRLLEGGKPGGGSPGPASVSRTGTAGRSEGSDAPEETPDQEGAEPAAAFPVHDLRLDFPAVICALGDLLLDVIVRVDGPIAADTDTYGRSRVAPGGQAANVAAWVAALGRPARFVGKRARDPAGRLLAGELTRRGVELAGPEVDAGTGTVVSLADPDGRRTMLTDRGVAPALAPGELDPAWFACEALHVPGYSLTRFPIGDAAREAVRLARESGATVSVDLSGTSAIEELGVGRFRQIVTGLRPDIVFGNEEEFDLAGRLEAQTLVIKRGARGCLVRRDGQEIDLPAESSEVIDTTGAGDAFAAGWLVGGPEVALAAAARCVASMGAFPS